MRRVRWFYAPGLSAALVLMLGACGRSAFADAKPDAVRITSHVVTADAPTTVTIARADIADALLRAAVALPPAPAERVCLAFAGPRYELAFLEGGKVVVTATADRGGCPSVTFGADDTRDADDAFWRLLERDIADATPPARPDRVVALTFAAPHRPATTATIAAPEQAQRLYDAILALPPLPQGQPCPKVAGSRHELAFYEAAKRIRATADRGGCGSVQLLPGSAHRADDAFWRLLDATLASVTSAPARPSELALKVEPAPGGPNATAKVGMIQNADLMQRLYAATYALPPLPQGQACDSIAGPRYGLSFASGEGIELLSVVADKGGCGTVDFGDGDVRLADGAFWDLVTQADRA